MASLETKLHSIPSYIPSAEGDEVGVVGGRGDGDGAGAADVRVAELVRQLLQLVRLELVVVPEHVVVRGPRRTLVKEFYFKTSVWIGLITPVRI